MFLISIAKKIGNANVILITTAMFVQCCFSSIGMFMH
jgi:hypothetical protein